MSFDEFLALLRFWAVLSDALVSYFLLVGREGGRVVGLSGEEERGELGQGMKRSLRSHLSLRTSTADLLRWFWFGATVFNFGSRFSVVHQNVLKLV
jgi:hypothetical protein